MRCGEYSNPRKSLQRVAGKWQDEGILSERIKRLIKRLRRNLEVGARHRERIYRFHEGSDEIDAGAINVPKRISSCRGRTGWMWGEVPSNYNFLYRNYPYTISCTSYPHFFSFSPIILFPLATLTLDVRGPVRNLTFELCWHCLSMYATSTPVFLDCLSSSLLHLLLVLRLQLQSESPNLMVQAPFYPPATIFRLTKVLVSSLPWFTTHTST